MRRAAVKARSLAKTAKKDITPQYVRHQLNLTANVINSESTCVVHPEVIVQVKGIKFRALLDSGASNSFVSETLVSLVGVKTSTRQISTLMGATTTKMSQFDLSFEALKGGFVLNARVTMIN
jgi:methionine synthase I (cobalamin-dependent)